MWELLKGGLKYATGSGVGSQLLRAGLGAGAAAMFAPRMAKVPVVTKSQLDATTLPAMRRSANRRLALLQGSQGAKGGLSSAEAFNTVTANQMAIDGAQRNYGADLSRFQNIFSGGLAGANMFDPTKKKKTNIPNAAPVQPAIPQPAYAPTADEYYSGLRSPIQQFRT